MKIERINLTEAITSQINLKAILMERLNKVVLIAGKNGAGKSRLLRLIREQVNHSPNSSIIHKLASDIKASEQTIASYLRQIEQSEEQLKIQTSSDANIFHTNQITNFRKSIELNERQIEKNKQSLELASYFTFSPEKEDNAVIDFVPKSLDLTDSYTLAPFQLDESAKNIFNIGTYDIALGAIPAIEKITRKWVNVNTIEKRNLEVSDNEQEKINADYKKLEHYIQLFLGTDLKRNSDGHAMLFGKRIGDANLSNGQKILLQFCMALFAQEASLENLVIFMDEPENHLHPAALIEVLDKITSHVTNGQVWIATHSINVLAHFDPSNIWYIDNGKISYAGTTSQKVLDGLLGNENEIDRVSHFLSLPAQMANHKFAFECLFYPNVVTTGSDDPQTKQIHEIITDKASRGEKLKVLDYGIGKARLISTIFENERLKDIDITQWLDFYGYDKFDTYKDICTKVLKGIYGDSCTRYFTKEKDLMASHDENTFDVIIMCNVFHEIEPSDWLSLFNSITSPFKLLKEDGYLVVVEDQFLAIGEKAHSKGFLVFDELEFKKLFQITTSDTYKSTDYRGDGRLKSHHIPKNCINRITSDSKKESLKTLIQNAKDEIKIIRKEKPSFKNGKLHSFWTQQLANASLALEEL